MESVNLIKQELIKQKQEIEAKFGVVNVKNLNPSPSEITEGIKSIPHQDLSLSTATESDVQYGKTFYSGSAVLRTGTAMHDQNALDALFMGPQEKVSYEGEIYYTFPMGASTRKYLFYANYNSATITFNEDLKTVAEYAFYKTINFKFTNFNDLTQIKQLNSYAFAMGSTQGIDLGRLPESITYLGPYCFYYSMQGGFDFVFPPNLTFLGQHSFMALERVVQNSIDFTNVQYTTLPTYCFYNNAFNCGFEVPGHINVVSTYFNFNGCFRDVTIHSNMKTVDNYSFGSSASAPISDFYLNSFTFEGLTPPAKIGTNIIAPQNFEHEFAIYVPDESVDEYKAVANLASYIDYIKPMSQKP